MFTLLNKAVRLNFSSYKCKLLKFSLTALLSSQSFYLTFDLLGLVKRLSPFCTEPFKCLSGKSACRVIWSSTGLNFQLSPQIFSAPSGEKKTLPSVTFMGCTSTCTYMYKLRNTLKILGTLTATVYKLAPSGLQERYKML